jgi:DNA adenine methylase
MPNNKPYLRWAGGKTWLVKHLPEILQNISIKQYHEPFLGGGAIYFAIGSKYPSYLSDTNKELIQTYICLKNSPRKIIRRLKTYINTEDFYYKLRDTVYNDPLDISARFIYLNQTSFNGLFRVNLKGIYNVPYGFKSKDFINEEQLICTSKLLASANIFESDFEIITENVKKNDLIFLDPPYTVSHNDNGFIKYNEKLFSISDQYRLSNAIDKLRRKGAFYILTNAAHKTVKEIFDKGDYVFEINRSSIIGGINAVRGQVSEYIFTNIRRS